MRGKSVWHNQINYRRPDFIRVYILTKMRWPDALIAMQLTLFSCACNVHFKYLSPRSFRNLFPIFVSRVYVLACELDAAANSDLAEQHETIAFITLLINYVNVETQKPRARISSASNVYSWIEHSNQLTAWTSRLADYNLFNE